MLRKRVSSKTVEQICSHEWSPGYRKWLKRWAHRLMRRTGKQLHDDAPRRYPFRGYSN